jgi:hypothetical protein
MGGFIKSRQAVDKARPFHKVHYLLGLRSRMGRFIKTSHQIYGVLGIGVLAIGLHPLKRRWLS